MTWFRRQDSRELTRKVTEKAEQWEREQLAERERRDRRARENEAARLAQTQATQGEAYRQAEKTDLTPPVPSSSTYPDRMADLAEAVGWTEGMAGELAGDIGLAATLGDDGPTAPTASQLARLEAEEERDRVAEAAMDREWLREMRVIW
jgi:hypothetical protein